MLNTIDAYREAGKRAAQAQNVNDAMAVKSWREHFQAMRDLERPEDRKAARDAYDDAYRATRVTRYNVR